MITPQPAPASASIIERKPRCGCSFPAIAAQGLPGWSSNNVSYFVRMYLRNLTQQQVDRAFDAAAESWNAVCGIVLKRGATTWANISAASGSIDGRYGTLAYSFMPGPKEPMGTSLRQVYDDNEDWTEQWFREVVAHEIGHAIGIDHSDDPNALMYPYADGKTMSPQKWDIQEALRRYPTVKPPPVTPSGKLLLEVMSVDSKRIQIWEVV